MHLIHTPRHSGAEALVKDLCLFHRERGIQSALVSFNSPEPAFVEELSLLAEGDTKLFVPDRALRKLARTRHIRRAYGDFGPDVVFAHSVLPALYGRLALPRIGRRPKFVTVLHSASNDDFSAPYLRALEYGLSGRAHAVVAVSREGAASYQRRFPRSSVRIISNGIKLDRFRELTNDLASEPKRGARSTLVQIGRISPVKQQHVSIQLTACLVHRGLDVEIQLAGLTEDPDYERSLRQLTKDQGIESRVMFLGGRSDVPQLLRAADLYLMPSLQEAHSVAFLEALASGIPILASNIPAFQFAHKFEGVRLYDGADLGELQLRAIELLAHPRSTSRMIDDFDIRRTADEYATLALELIGA
ncbi:glycosyltransferase family 4 protein [Bradyrhizobium genomosp. III]|uniref:glycosyltransferase family 4 protein n=1 Tax=Bradyrhizobium genomosp. III TaxID=2683271 RepID=UPI0024BF2B6C|nr:glycosyltransferase family 4 protein [Bradyrhizobium sp. CCBAU 15635]